LALPSTLTHLPATLDSAILGATAPRQRRHPEQCAIARSSQNKPGNAVRSSLRPIDWRIRVAHRRRRKGMCVMHILATRLASRRSTCRLFGQFFCGPDHDAYLTPGNLGGQNGSSRGMASGDRWPHPKRAAATRHRDVGSHAIHDRVDHCRQRNHAFARPGGAGTDAEMSQTGRRRRSSLQI
jgi:hypothetical protein